jgi:hypothetical protein
MIFPANMVDIMYFNNFIQIECFTVFYETKLISFPVTLFIYLIGK